MNLLLGLFNLIPAFPLDGGRLLSTWIWHRRGDREQAVVRAARVGRVFAWMLIGLGVLEFLVATANLQGLWLVLLGGFLIWASRGEETGVILRRSLEGLRVAQAMSAPAVVVPDWITVAEFMERYAQGHHFSTFPTRDFEGHPTGMFRLRRLLAVPFEARQALQVRRVVVPLDQVPRAAPEEMLLEVLPRMQGPTDGRMLVMEGGQVVGVLAPTDVSRAIQVASLLRRPPA